MAWTNKKVLVVGMGKSGIAAAEALLRAGASVTLYDQKSEEEISVQMRSLFRSQGAVCCFGEDPKNPQRFEMVVMSPGVPESLPFVMEAEAAGAEVIGELELAWRMGKGKYVAITGTNGKTTTTVLTGEIFKTAGRKTEVVGNVGIATVSKAVSVTDDTWMITEVSSFQLTTIKDFHPVVSALLNITPDHLDRHGTLEQYAQAKARIYQNQTKDDFFVVNYDDPGAWAKAADCRATLVPFSKTKEFFPGCFLQDGRITIGTQQGERLDICGADQLQIPGTHNLENALAAAAISYFSGVEPGDIGRSLSNFHGVEHRLEFCGKVNGVRFVNDSKGTNPEASIKAIQSMDTPVVLIAGGYDKKARFDPFIDEFGTRVKTLILMGATAQQLRQTALKKGFSSIVMCKDMEQCVREAAAAAQSGDTVLLSPACASWDMYSSYEQRGRHFKTCVANLER